MLMVPAINTSPLASIVSGLLVELRVKVIVTPVGMLTVVKLKTPLSGTATDAETVGENGPSAPVEPLLKLFCACRVPVAQNNESATATIANRRLLIKRCCRKALP